jgi:hypothetical protein
MKCPERGELAVVVASLVLFSCARRSAPVWQSPDTPTWRAIQQTLTAEREARPRAPWAAGVSVVMHEPRTARVVDGRGAIAVAPGRGLRMILVGAAGMTMLDAWVTRDKWRIAVPPAAIVRRGDLEEPRELPIAFLRWSFFRPLEGTLFAGAMHGDHVLFLLRDHDAVLEVRRCSCDRGELTLTTRRLRGRAERLDECRAASAPRPGDWVHYESDASGLRVDLAIETVAKDAPEEDAFRDPDGVAR